MIIKGNQLKIEVPKHSSWSGTFWSGRTSFCYIESKIEQLLLREVIEG